MKRLKSLGARKYLILLAILFPFLRSFNDIVTGIIPFWVDPALDFLLAVENLSKPRLIGQPSGIGGIFYGPYTVWLTSLVLLTSKDPRVTTFFLHTLPYFTLFPLLLYRLTSSYGVGVFTSLWLLFIYSHRNYTTYLWSPHHAPLLLLLLVYLVATVTKRSRLRYLVIGFVAGLVANFHISFGSVVVVTTLLYFLVPLLCKLRGLARGNPGWRFRLVRPFFLVFVGLLFAFLPAILFELRHDFLQTKALVAILTDSAQGRTAIQLEGLGKREVVFSFFASLTRLVLLPPRVTPFLYGAAFLASFWPFLRKPLPWLETEKRLVRYLLLLSVVTLGVYLSVNNPVWHYHFIGVETIFLLALGIMSGKNMFVRRLLEGAAAIVVVLAIFEFGASLKHDPLAVPSLTAKQHVVEMIYADARQGEFAVSVYSPSLLTYDYDYLFSWIASERRVLPAGKDISQVKVVYLVIPEANPKMEARFIQSTTPDERYLTLQEWRTVDKTLIVKRELKDSEGIP